MKPLEGFKILDFSQFFAGPIATLLLSDMGAEVIKLENPPLGDNNRYGNAVVNDKSSHYTTHNYGKKSVIMNLKDERQKAIFFEMVRTADVVLENGKPGTLDKYGVTYDKLKQINPSIVYTSISGYGQTGPYRDHAAFDSAVQGEAGLISITGELGSKGVRCGVAVADAIGGLMGCIGTLAALINVQRTGEGSRVDISMMDSIVAVMENYISAYNVTGKIPEPMGNGIISACPFRDYTCKDGKNVLICISTDSQFKSYCEMIGHTEWLDNPKFQTMALRANNRDELEPLVEAAMLEIDSVTLCEEMQKRKLVYGHINNVAQVVEHPQVAARNMIVNAVYPDGTSFKVPGCPIKMNNLEDPAEYEAAPLGYHTFDILSRYVDSELLHDIYDEVLQNCDTVAKSKYHAGEK